MKPRWSISRPPRRAPRHPARRRRDRYLHRAHPAPENFVARRHQEQHEVEERHPAHHDEQRRQHRRVNGRAAGAEDALTLVQRVPPVDRELDDRQVDGADQRKDRRRPRRPPRIFHRLPERDQPEIDEEQHQLRGQPRVPHPVGAPHRLAPQRPVTSATKVKAAPIGAAALPVTSASGCRHTSVPSDETAMTE